MKVAPFLIALSILLFSCTNEPASEVDAATFDAPSQDAVAECENPAEALPTNWRSIDTVSTGEIEDTHEGSLRTLLVDATAGGFQNSSTSPYVYISLTNDSAQKSEITDTESYQNDSWDVAFKRYVIRINGGDSGMASVAVAEVNANTLDEITDIPSDDQFITDNWANPDCSINEVEFVGGPQTAMGLWFVAGGSLVPRDVVYVLRLRDNTYIKLKIASYYGDPADPNRSAYYAIQWQPLSDT